MKGRLGPGLAFALPLLLVLFGPALAEERDSALADIKVAYLERPPYYWTDNGQPRGFLLELTQRIFSLAGIKAIYAPAPPNRIIADLRENSQPTCSIGWFKNPERESYAKFSLPIYRDKPLVILTSKDRVASFRQHDRLQDVFADPSLVLARVASFSFGEAVDGMLEEIPARNLTVSSAQNVLPRLILEGRVSYMLVAPEEVSTLLRSAGVDPGLFVQLTMMDIPAGNLRHLIFSAGVNEETLSKVNSAIKVLTDQDSLFSPEQP